MWVVIAGMQGMSGFPAGYYRNELEIDEEEHLRIHICDQNWIDLVNDEGQVVYDLVQIDRYEYVSKEEADYFYWDWTA